MDMTRVWSGAGLAALAIALVWFAPPAAFFVAAELLLILGFKEYVTLARARGLDLPWVASAVAPVLTCAALAGPMAGRLPPIPLDVVLTSSLVVIGTLSLSRWREGPDALPLAAAALFPALYLGLPIGAMVSVRDTHGPAALFLLMLTVMVSDTAQYYTGRAFGRRPLAPAISPKKTIEGAVGGFVFGPIVLAVVGAWWLPAVAMPARVGLGVVVVAFGIAGDLFESMLKRSAGVKDSSSLIPGHGGVLDRVDALLFAAPIYYVVLKYV